MVSPCQSYSIMMSEMVYIAYILHILMSRTRPHPASAPGGKRRPGWPPTWLGKGLLGCTGLALSHSEKKTRLLARMA